MSLVAGTEEVQHDLTARSSKTRELRRVKRTDLPSLQDNKRTVNDIVTRCLTDIATATRIRTREATAGDLPPTTLKILVLRATTYAVAGGRCWPALTSYSSCSITESMRLKLTSPVGRHVSQSRVKGMMATRSAPRMKRVWYFVGWKCVNQTASRLSS